MARALSTGTLTGSMKMRSGLVEKKFISFIASGQAFFAKRSRESACCTAAHGRQRHWLHFSLFLGDQNGPSLS